MCGIVGAVTRDPGAAEGRIPAVRRILEKMAYRGPDAHGLWASPHVVLGHRRLSIIDLSDAGTQPLHDSARGLHIVFNGEIYNYRDLRADLERQGYAFRTGTDTEAILGAYHVYGREFLAHLRGMFAFILYDEPGGRVLLCRDRMGKKPLYYYCGGGQLLAASEIKALYAFEGISLEIDQASLRAYFALQYVPGPATILKSVKRVAPGQCVELDLRTWRMETRQFWSINDCLASPAAVPADIGRIDAAIRESVRYRLIADVEVAVMLSGGIDSSLLACYAAELSGGDLKAFVVSFGQRDLDESAYAQLVADSLHVELVRIDGGGLDEDIFQRAVYHADEPLGDPACIPTFMISEVIARHVKVVLSGEGADELFWGYDHYRRQLLFDRLGPLLPRLGPVRGLGGFLAGIENSTGAGGALTRLSKILSADGDMGCARWTTVFGQAALEQLMPGTPAPDRSAELRDALAALKAVAGPSEAAMALDLLYWLPDDLLVKVDRMSMAHSIEARAPFLDHVLVETALRTPACLKADLFKNKKVLRALLMEKLPQETARRIGMRKKHGFDVPLARWLTHELRDLADHYFAEHRVRATGMLDSGCVQGLWSTFNSRGGTVHFARKLWLVLCFLTWYGHHKNRFGF